MGTATAEHETEASPTQEIPAHVEEGGKILNIVLSIVKQPFRPSVIIATLCFCLVAVVASGTVLIWKTHDKFNDKLDGSVAKALEPHVAAEKLVTDGLSRQLDDKTAPMQTQIESHERQLQELRTAIGEVKGGLTAVNQSVQTLDGHIQQLQSDLRRR